MGMHTYSPQDQRFHFAAWAAGRAYGRGGKGLSVPAAINGLSKPEIKKLANGLQELPKSRDDFDAAHDQWCQMVVKSFGPGLTYGRAAKLVNVYLKALFLPDFGREAVDDPVQTELLFRTNFIHPPIDRILLDTLAKADTSNAKAWRELCSLGWTRFDQLQYHDVIKLITKKTSGELWRIEEYWTP